MPSQLKTKKMKAKPLLSYSALRDRDRPPLVRLLPLPLPLSLFIEVTNICNFRCKFCPESFVEFEEIVGGLQNMDMALFTKLCKEIGTFGTTKVVRFYMLGEPLLNKNLPTMIRMVKEISTVERTEVTTNASALTLDISERLIESGLDYLRVSIYSVDQTRHQLITGSTIDITTIINNVNAFRQLRKSQNSSKPYLYVKMIDSFNNSENEKFMTIYQPIADEVMIEKPMNWNNYNNMDIISPAYSVDFNISYFEKQLFPFPKEVCPFPFYTLVVSANGDVTVCCVDWNKKTLIGNISENSLYELWHSCKMRDFRKMHIERRRIENESCHNCTYLFTCPDNLDGLTQKQYQEIIL